MLFDQGLNLGFISVIWDVKALGPVRIEDSQGATHLDVFVLDQGIFLPAYLFGEVGVCVKERLHVVTDEIVGRIVYLRTRLDVESEFFLSYLFHEA